MTDGRITTETTVNDGQVTVPEPIRRELAIEGGDQLRWHVDGSGEVRIEVVHRRAGTFEAFDGYSGDEETDVVADHDGWGND